MIDALVPDFANFLSATKMSVAAKKILFLGCGAIGSKLIYHLYRCGICELTICDNDFMQPHNVCRHAVTSSGLFKYKVDLIINDLRSMYPMMPCPVKTVSEDILQWLPKTDLSAYDIIIDATASASVIRCIDKLRDKITVPIVHYSLSDGGNIGHVYINKSRTTLVADFYMLLVAQAINNDDISDWLFHEKEYSLDYVRVGEGCHSNTMILSDDVISTHTSIASRVIREIDNICGNQAFFSFIGDGFMKHTAMFFMLIV